MSWPDLRKVLRVDSRLQGEAAAVSGVDLDKWREGNTAIRGTAESRALRVAIPGKYI
jgi:hypothetical protein